MSLFLKIVGALLANKYFELTEFRYLSLLAFNNMAVAIMNKKNTNEEF